jgi:hypothetical protein
LELEGSDQFAGHRVSGDGLFPNLAIVVREVVFHRQGDVDLDPVRQVTGDVGDLSLEDDGVGDQGLRPSIDSFPTNALPWSVCRRGKTGREKRSSPR